jgi:AraC family transcriptional regulator
MTLPLSKVDPASPLVFKRRAAWDGLRLEHYRFQSGELPEHWHTEHTVLISLSDGCPAELRTGTGIRIVGTQKRGSICVLPSGLTHKASLGGPSEHVALYVEPSLLNRAAAESKLPGGFELLERYTREDAVISSIGMALLGELDSDGPSGRLYAESLTNLLAMHLLRHYTSANNRPQLSNGGLSGQKLRRVMNFIAENFANDIKLGELAHAAGMSNFHFAREFKRTTGTTPHQYLIRFRIDRAKSLLGNKNLSLAEVGLLSGFSHQSHFTRLFRKITGATPHAYRVGLQP